MTERRLRLACLILMGCNKGRNHAGACHQRANSEAIRAGLWHPSADPLMSGVRGCPQPTRLALECGDELRIFSYPRNVSASSEVPNGR